MWSLSLLNFSISIIGIYSKFHIAFINPTFLYFEIVAGVILQTINYYVFVFVSCKYI